MAQALLFGSSEVRPAERVLIVDGAPVAIGARAFDVLMALLERRDRVVSKNELLDLVWAGLVVEENNLSVQISALRKVLGAKAIATVSGRGYRFVAEVSGYDEAPAPAPAPAAPAADERSMRPLRPAKPERSERLDRRLATLVRADVIDWLPWVRRDPAVAVGAWRAVRRDLIEPRCPVYGGRILELTANGLLAEFVSAVDALAFALELQRRLAQAPSTSPAAADGAPAQRLQMRLAVHLDDVIVDDGRLLGDGVHNTGELVNCAGPGEVVVSEVVRVLALGKTAIRFEPLTAPCAVVAGAPFWVVRDAPPGAGIGQAPVTVSRASLAVLPFATDRDEDRYFGDGLTEEIITAVSRNHALLVIARASTLRYRGSTRAPAEIAEELGVRYLLTGAAHRDGQQLRLRAELVDAPAARVIWAEGYDGDAGDLFDFQSRIAASIAAAIDPRVHEAEIARVVPLPTGRLSAYDSVLRGLAVIHNFDDGGFVLAGELMRRAIAIDPLYAQAHAYLAYWHNLRVGEGRSAEVGEDAQMAIRHSLRAVELDPRDAVVLSVAGHLQSFLRRDYRAALEMFDQALASNPNSAVAWARSATTLAYMGDGEQAIQRLAVAYRLSPFDPLSFWFYTTHGTAAFVSGRFAEAAAWLAKARRRSPRYLAALRMSVAALADAGEIDEAHALAQELLVLEPTFDVGQFGSWYPLREPHLARLLAALRRAGLPG